MHFHIATEYREGQTGAYTCTLHRRIADPTRRQQTSAPAQRQQGASPDAPPAASAAAGWRAACHALERDRAASASAAASGRCPPGSHAAAWHSAWLPHRRSPGASPARPPPPPAGRCSATAARSRPGTRTCGVRGAPAAPPGLPPWRAAAGAAGAAAAPRTAESTWNQNSVPRSSGIARTPVSTPLPLARTAWEPALPCGACSSVRGGSRTSQQKKKHARARRFYSFGLAMHSARKLALGKNKPDMRPDYAAAQPTTVSARPANRGIGCLPAECWQQQTRTAHQDARLNHSQHAATAAVAAAAAAMVALRLTALGSPRGGCAQAVRRRPAAAGRRLRGLPLDARRACGRARGRQRPSVRPCQGLHGFRAGRARRAGQRDQRRVQVAKAGRGVAGQHAALRSSAPRMSDLASGRLRRRGARDAAARARAAPPVGRAGYGLLCGSAHH